MRRTKRPTLAQKKAAGEATGKSKYAAKKGHPSKTSPFNLEYQRNSQAARVRKSIFERQVCCFLKSWYNNLIKAQGESKKVFTNKNGYGIILLV